MLSSRIVTMLETHAEQLTQRVMEELRTHPRTPSYHHLNPEEDHSRVFAVVRNLRKSLDSASDGEMEAAYRNLGQRRFREGVPLAEVVYALMVTKQTIRRYIQAEGWVDSALDLHHQVELYNRVNRFFDRAVYFVVVSYSEQAHVARISMEQLDTRKRDKASQLRWRKAAGAV